MTNHPNKEATQASSQIISKPLTSDEVRNFVATEGCLKGKTILVTGASAGIGRVAALSYANYGATVLLLSRNSSKLEAVYDEIESNGGSQPAILPMDLEKATYAEMQQLEGLINK